MYNSHFPESYVGRKNRNYLKVVVFLNANTLKLKLFFLRIAGMPVVERVSHFLFLGQNKRGPHELKEG